MIKKILRHKLFPIICVIAVLIIAPIAFYFIQSEMSISYDYNYQNWYHVKFDKNWTPAEIRAWNKLLNHAIPDLVEEFGKPPLEIKINLKKGDFEPGILPSGSAGFIYNFSEEYQKIYCSDPRKMAGVCLHEITHSIFIGYEPVDWFFQDGPAIYMQYKLGKLYNAVNFSNPENFEYCYQMGDNFMRADNIIFAPYGSKNKNDYSARSSYEGVSRVQYGIYGYFWKILNEKFPQYSKKFASELWKYKLTVKGTVPRIYCVEAAKNACPQFEEWYNERKSLIPNVFIGDRFIVLAWPTENDLTALHWFTELEDGEIFESCYNGRMIVNIYSKDRLVESTKIAIKDGTSRNDNFIKKAKLKYGLPLTIVVETVGDNMKLLSDKIEITK